MNYIEVKIGAIPHGKKQKEKQNKKSQKIEALRSIQQTRIFLNIVASNMPSVFAEQVESKDFCYG